MHRITKYKTRYSKKYGGNYYSKRSIRDLSKRWARAERRSRRSMSQAGF